MVTESFVASCGLQSPADKKQYNPVPAVKDAAIAVHALAPLPAVSQIFKKGAAATGCLAVSDEHIFAAQADRAVVVVYSRERGNQECVVAFQEKVTALAGTCADSTIAMGTESGRLMLWETCTGRLVSVAAPHLQAVSCIVASPDSNFLISGSKDSTLQVWSVPSLLAFGGPSEGRSALHALTSHRAAVTALTLSGVTGRGAIAISASEDGTVIIWDYVMGNMLRTVLLSDAPTSLVMDPVDRGFFAGFQDGSVQLVDFYDSSTDRTSSELNPIHDSNARRTPLQPPASSRWRHQASKTSPISPTLSLALTFDGAVLLSGHANGHIMAWDVGRRGWQKSVIVMAGPVTNLCMLPVQDWPQGREPPSRRCKIDKVVKPRFESEGQQTNGHSVGGVPGNYTLTARFTQLLDSEAEKNDFVPSRSERERSALREALMCPTGFPSDLLEDSIANLATWRESGTRSGGPAKGTQESQQDFMALDDTGAESGKPARLSMEAQNALLKEKIAALQRVQRVTFRQLDDLRAERKHERARGTADAVNDRRTDVVENEVVENFDALTGSAAEFVAAEGAEEKEERSRPEVVDLLPDVED